MSWLTTNRFQLLPMNSNVSELIRTFAPNVHSNCMLPEWVRMKSTPPFYVSGISKLCGKLIVLTDLPLKGTKKRKMQKNRESMRQKMVQN